MQDHFGLVDITTPPVAIAALLIEVSSAPLVLSVAAKGTLASNHDAIGMVRGWAAERLGCWATG